MLADHFLQGCNYAETGLLLQSPCGVLVHYKKLVITHLSTLCWHRTCFYYHRFLSIGAVFYFSHFLFPYSDVCFVYMGFQPAIEYNE